MILLWFLLGIILITLISRYNESNKLFWILFASFVGAFTVASIVLNTNKDNKSKTNVVHAYNITNSTNLLYAKATEDTYVAKELVVYNEKKSTHVQNNICFTSINHCIEVEEKPPQLC